MLPRHRAPELPDLPDPRLNPGRKVQLPHLAQAGRIPEDGDGLCRGRRMTKGIWGWGVLWALTTASLTLLNVMLFPLLHPRFPHCPLQVSLTWSQTPTTCKLPLTSREPTCTPCAAQQRRSAWPGKELRMKLGALGQSLGVTQNPQVCQAACNPHDLGQASEPLRTWPSSSVSLACPKGVRRGREQAVIQRF